MWVVEAARVFPTRALPFLQTGRAFTQIRPDAWPKQRVGQASRNVRQRFVHTVLFDQRMVLLFSMCPV
jgi:hypothetical protein